jgi:hypothetical protein
MEFSREPDGGDRVSPLSGIRRGAPGTDPRGVRGPTPWRT